MARRIAFINYKGGVGKTSLIVNLAACLAKLGKRILLCDFDTQSNASIWLLKLERWNKINAANEGALYSIFDPGRARLRDIVVKVGTTNDISRGNEFQVNLMGNVQITTQAVREIASRHHLRAVAAVAVGRAVTAGLTLATLTKDEEQVTLQILGNGPLGSITVDAR